MDLHHLSVLRTLPHLMAPAGRQVLVDLHHLSVLRALPHLLAPVGRRDLVGQHLPSAHPFNGKSCWTSYGIRTCNRKEPSLKEAACGHNFSWSGDNTRLNTSMIGSRLRATRS